MPTTGIPQFEFLQNLEFHGDLPYLFGAITILAYRPTTHDKLKINEGPCFKWGRNGTIAGCIRFALHDSQYLQLGLTHAFLVI